ncbi:MAG: hypothetical protein CMB48_06705 [Euryarchaeota archaeon]|nr:hypothetical protein [Euryarchaeota archaeon]
MWCFSVLLITFVFLHHYMAEDLEVNWGEEPSLKEKFKKTSDKTVEISKKAMNKSVEVGGNIASEVKKGAKKATEKSMEIGSNIASEVKKSASKLSDSSKNVKNKFIDNIEKKRDELKEKRELKKSSNNSEQNSETQTTPPNNDIIEVIEENKEEDKIILSKKEYQNLLANNEKNNSFKSADIKKLKNKNKKNETFLIEVSNSLNDIMSVLSVTIVFAALLVGVEYYLNSNPQKIGEISIEFLIWPIGTAIWSFYILNKLAKARTFLKMPLGMRIQTAIGVGLATELALILSTDTAIVTNIWGWTAIVALTTILLSGFLKGFIGSFYSKFRKDKEIIDID